MMEETGSFFIFPTPPEYGRLAAGELKMVHPGTT